MTVSGIAEVESPVESQAVECPEPFAAWPGWKHIGYTTLLGLLNTFWFTLVFVGADALTAHRSFRVRVHFSWELGIPLVPAMILFYMSIYLAFLAAPFIVRRRQEVRVLVGTLALVIFLSGIGFLLFPADLAFAPPDESALGVWAGMFHLADKLNLTYNLVPSLHVALVVACVTVFSTYAPARGKVLLWLWAVLIAISTVLTHQHHLLDAVTGWLLAVICVRVAYTRLVAMQSPLKQNTP